MYKVKYRISDGEILAWGPMPDLQAGPGEAVEDTTEYKNVVGKVRVDQNNFREKNSQEKVKEDNEKKIKKNRLKQKLALAGIDRETMQAIRELDPEDL